MAFKQRSSGLPFKEIGSSPAKAHEPGHKPTHRKIKAFLHGGEENLQKKEEVGEAKRGRRERRKEARHANRLAKINKPTRAERKQSKREGVVGELD
jgi:hypothetical protein